MQLAMLESGSKSGDELAAEHSPQHGNGKEEVWVRSNPTQFAILLQLLADDVFQLGWYRRIQPYRRRRSSIEDTVEDGC